MCLAIPEKILKVDKKAKKATVAGGKKIDITLVPDVKAGEYLLVHAGLAVQSMKAEEAEETLRVAASCEHSHPGK
ncbi:MAG: HypC/HybG/HupF family hydrogenase formation chaperone [archaeon]